MKIVPDSVLQHNSSASDGQARTQVSMAAERKDGEETGKDGSVESRSNSIELSESFATLSYKERRRLKNPQRKRHGARNQDKAKQFVRWLIDHFPDIFQGDGATDKPILDVAGGKGELAARLCVCHGRKVVMVDPRPSDPRNCFETTVLPKIPNKWQAGIQNKMKENPRFLDDLFQERFVQHVTTFDDMVLQDNDDGLPGKARDIGNEKARHSVRQAIQECCLIVGMHADGATEAIVDAGLKYDKPFVVTPCCVFPNLFPMRFLPPNADATRQEQIQLDQKQQVRTHEQFCRYLALKDPRIKTSTLPFEGRNVAIWWSGPQSDSIGG